MVCRQIDVGRIAVGKAKHYPPVAGDQYGSEMADIPAEMAHTQTWNAFDLIGARRIVEKKASLP
jgi:hypothetical protein